ncbi:MAG: phosphopantetheine-binding protein, partial [Planctomycetota bacterium]
MNLAGDFGEGLLEPLVRRIDGELTACRFQQEGSSYLHVLERSRSYDVRNRVAEILADELGVAPKFYAAETQPINDLGLGSLDAVELLEDELDLS